MKKILVIEDDSNITTALSIRLKAAGYEVLTAPDGLHGLKLARNHWPDLILLDVGLPLLDIRMPLGVGYSVARRLKAMGLGEIPIIFITASKEKGVREAATEAGAAGFFEKPYDPEELLRAIDHAIRARGGSTSGMADPSGATAEAPPSPSERSCPSGKTPQPQQLGLAEAPGARAEAPRLERPKAA